MRKGKTPVIILQVMHTGMKLSKRHLPFWVILSFRQLNQIYPITLQYNIPFKRKREKKSQT